MNPDATSPNSMSASPSQRTTLARLDSSNNLGLPLEQSAAQPMALAVKQDFTAISPAIEESQLSTSPIVDSFLPSPSRLMVIGGLVVVGALGLGALASALLTHRVTVNAPARVDPVGNVQTIQSGGGGTVANILVQNYETIEADQIIASFEDSALRAEISNLETQIADIRKNITQVDNELATLEQNRALERRFQLDVSQTQFEYSKALLLQHLQELNNQLDQQRQQLAAAQQEIDNRIVRAPAAGTLYELGLNSLGQTVGTNEPIAKLVPAETALEIKALVPAKHINNVEVGYPTRISLSTCKALNFGFLRGEVSSVEPAGPAKTSNYTKIDATTDKNSYIVTIDANEEDLKAGSQTCKLLPGTEGELTIIAKQEKFLNFFLRKLRLKTDV